MSTSSSTPNDTQQANHPSPKALATKALVLVLCVCSFFAGFYAHQSRQINHCKAHQGEIAMQGSVVICQNAAL